MWAMSGEKKKRRKEERKERKRERETKNAGDEKRGRENENEREGERKRERKREGCCGVPLHSLPASHTLPTRTCILLRYVSSAAYVHVLRYARSAYV